MSSDSDVLTRMSLGFASPIIRYKNVIVLEELHVQSTENASSNSFDKFSVIMEMLSPTTAWGVTFSLHIA